MNDNEIMNALSGRRMMSLGNLGVALDCPWQDLVTQVRDLEQQSQVRVVTSQCGGSCSSCSGCDETAEPEWSDRSIVISLTPLENA